jgi:hypothetical protein
MRFIFDTDYDYLMLLPYIALTDAKCDDAQCRASHGFALMAGWLIWNVGIHFQKDENQ